MYIFGFSRGPYTARFLREMVNGVGIFSRGNEEMVHFAWTIISGYQQICGKANKSDNDKMLEEKMAKFKATFCSPHVNVHFLGLFDCVNSVGQFELPFFPASSERSKLGSNPHLTFCIHNERRLKFKPALFLLDERRPKDQEMKEF